MISAGEEYDFKLIGETSLVRCNLIKDMKEMREETMKNYEEKAFQAKETAAVKILRWDPPALKHWGPGGC